MLGILGASGFIGNKLYAQLRDLGEAVVGTYCHTPDDNLVHFDFRDSSFDEFLDSHDFSSVVISAAAHVNIDDSKRFWKDAYTVNVTRTKEFLDACFRRGVVPIYISTDNVFDGRDGGYKEDAARNPINSYGQIRYEVENHLLDSSHPYVLLRMGKVFGLEAGDGTLLTALLEKLKSGAPMNCATDQIMTPVCIDDLVGFVCHVHEHNIRGTFHIASLGPTTVFDLANTLAIHHNLDRANITPCEINALGLLDERPLNINLDSTKYKSLAGIKERDLGLYLDRIN